MKTIDNKYWKEKLKLPLFSKEIEVVCKKTYSKESKT